MATADDSPTKSSFGTTMTLGGQGTAAQAAAADDTELTHFYRHGYGYHGGYRGYYGGYRGYYGGFGYGYGRGYGYGYRPYYGGYYGGYRPYYGYSSFASYSYPSYYGGYGLGCGYGGYGAVGYSYSGYSSYGGGFYGIAGTKEDASAPVVSLALKVANNPLTPREPAPTANADGSFRYDGGPANPVPQPKADAEPSARANLSAGSLPVSLPKAKPAGPYTYKAYGEK